MRYQFETQHQAGPGVVLPTVTLQQGNAACAKRLTGVGVDLFLKLVMLSAIETRYGGLGIAGHSDGVVNNSVETVDFTPVDTQIRPLMDT